MRYSILLFDLDDTLLDFGANEAQSLEGVFHQHGYSFSEELFEVYRGVNRKLWAEYESGLIPLETVLNTRFSKALERLGASVDGAEWEAQYRELLGNGCQRMEGAFEVCRDLADGHRLFVITNGVAATQRKRLRMSGLSNFFEDVFDSQTIGYQKPSQEFFKYVMVHIPDFSREEALVIGDSLHTDILGGMQTGIDTCWIHKEPMSSTGEIQSTYTITALAELREICAR